MPCHPSPSLSRFRVNGSHFCLSSVRERRRSEAWLRLIVSRSGGGKAYHDYLHSDLHDWAVPCPLLFPCLAPAGSMAHNLRLASWGKATPASHRGLNPWVCTHKGGGFPYAIVVRTTLPKAVEWLPVPSLYKIADILVKRGHVFTRGPSPLNPYVLQLFKVLLLYSHTGVQKWKCKRDKGSSPGRLTTAIEMA
jgi:hypothetical protein